MDDLFASVRRIAVDTGFSGVIRLNEANDKERSEALGWAHRGFQVPNTDETQFAVASGGKAFTALAAVRMIADGALSLDTPARSVHTFPRGKTELVSGVEPHSLCLV